MAGRGSTDILKWERLEVLGDPFLFPAKLCLLLATVFVNGNIRTAAWRRNWGHLSAQAEVWVMPLARPFFQWELQLFGSLMWGQGWRKTCRIKGKQVYLSNTLVRVHASGKQNVLLCFLVVFLFLSVLTTKTIVIFLIPYYFGKVVVCSFSFPCTFPTPVEGLVCPLVGCAFLTFWCVKHSRCFDFVLLRNDPWSVC